MDQFIPPQLANDPALEDQLANLLSNLYSEAAHTGVSDPGLPLLEARYQELLVGKASQLSDQELSAVLGAMEEDALERFREAAGKGNWTDYLLPNYEAYSAEEVQRGRTHILDRQHGDFTTIQELAVARPS